MDRQCGEGKFEDKVDNWKSEIHALPDWYAGILWVFQYGKLFVDINIKLRKTHL
jgi:hypothetical protein